MTQRQIPQKRQKDIKTKNKYNFLHTHAIRWRQRQSYSKHGDQSNKHTRQPLFNQKHSEPITNMKTPQPNPRAPSKQKEINKKMRQKQKIKSTNENTRIKPFPQSGIGQIKQPTKKSQHTGT